MNDGPIAAVVPAFHPGPEVVDLVRSLAGQVDAVVVVADGPDVVDAEVRRALQDTGATLVDHDVNQGIAAALNTGIATARARDLAAVLTVDQDSSVPAGYVATLRSTWLRAAEVGTRVGLVAPQHVSGLPEQKNGRVPVQSGLLIPEATLRQVGPFDEGLFIDGVDADYALRCLDAGLSLVVAEGAAVGHRLGGAYERQVLGRTLTLTRSQPFRYYYMTRNRLWLVRRHSRRHPGWAVAQLGGLARHLALVQAFVPDRRGRIAEVGRGVRDGVRS